MDSGAGNTIEARHRNAYFTFGRFQPPTLGHGLLIGELAAAAEAEGADAYVFVSSTQDKKKNPLTVFQKVAWLKLMFPTTNARFINTTTCPKGYMSDAQPGCRTLFAAVDVLRSAGYKGVKMFVGSDRVHDFSILLNKRTNGGNSDNSIEVDVIGVGAERNLSTGLSGMSGTKMRAAAAANNVERFAAGTGLSEDTAAELMSQVKAGMTGGTRSCSCSCSCSRSRACTVKRRRQQRQARRTTIKK